MSEELKRLERQMIAKRKNLEEWRRSHVHELSLPSGLDVLVRDVSMTDLMFSGQLPEGMLTMAEEAAKRGEEGIDLRAVAKNAAEFGQMLDALAKMALVEPKVGLTPDDSHVTLGELSGDDKMAIYNWVNREVAALRPFREGEGEPGAAGSSGGGVRTETEPIPGSRNGSGSLGD